VDKEFTFTEEELSWVQEAYYEHFLDNRYEHEDADYYSFMIGLGVKIGAISEDEI
jgi:hypothetical protein